MLTINLGVLLAVIVFFRLRRRTEARSRNDEKFTVVIVLALGVVIAPTPVGEGILEFLGQLASGITDSSR
ncbi:MULTISPECIES: hypothetical protein [Streptomyces]|uniref:Uncharacterized protein n=1 Tax=Streptomyces arboris TaxID=2600619 RepID=A0A5N5EBD2_9ACTN|nr:MULTISPECIES: hypothetical protein [Streptomyces]KAB2587746.1 hypothetical protein F5983_36255 [Streptomyces arboris]MCD9899811.1 hypothetical protein [Streptomyces sp. MT29]OKJ10605.1 hypothetical protein AMK21_30525 [Streptomyces sp. CB00316]